VALTSCTVPAAGKPTFELGDSEIELGIGIHGEPGRTARRWRRHGRSPRRRWTRSPPDMRWPAIWLVMVNGMGGTPLIELYIVYNEVQRYLAGQGARVTDRNLVGN